VLISVYLLVLLLEGSTMKKEVIRWVESEENGLGA
jgi:hypothetical protein